MEDKTTKKRLTLEERQQVGTMRIQTTHKIGLLIDGSLKLNVSRLYVEQARSSNYGDYALRSDSEF